VGRGKGIPLNKKGPFGLQSAGQEKKVPEKGRGGGSKEKLTKMKTYDREGGGVAKDYPGSSVARVEGNVPTAKVT